MSSFRENNKNSSLYFACKIFICVASSCFFVSYIFNAFNSIKNLISNKTRKREAYKNKTY